MENNNLENSNIDNPYAKEAYERWGHTKTYKESQKRVKNMSKEEFIRIVKEGKNLIKEIVNKMDKSPDSKEIQELILKHYNNLGYFYEPNIKIYRGLGNMYVDDKRFTEYYDKYRVGLAVFMRDAINIFCDKFDKK